MKNRLFFTLLLLCNFGIVINAQIKVNSTGLVKIGSLEEPTKNLDIKGTCIIKTVPYTSGNLIIDNTGFQGYQPSVYPEVNNAGEVGKINKAFKNMYCYSLTQLSDIRQKENVRDIENALDMVLKLKGVKYDLKKEYAYNDSSIKDSKYEASLEKDRKNKIGFIAQDVYKILPEVTVYDEATDVYGIEYSRIIPVLVEAIKEQQLLIDGLLSENATSKTKSTQNLTTAETSDLGENALFQNAPNPFTENTKIEFYLNEKVSSATIFIYDMNGLQKKGIALTSRGYGNIIIYGNELQAGMYMYTLIADGKTIDIKRMILTD